MTKHDISGDVPAVPLPFPRPGPLPFMPAPHEEPVLSLSKGERGGRGAPCGCLARGQSGARTAPAPTRARARTQMRAVKGRSTAGPERQMNTSRTKELPPMPFPDPTAPHKPDPPGNADFVSDHDIP